MKHYKNLPKAEKLPFWQAHIKAWQESGRDQKNYCASHQLNYRTFQYWYYRCKKEEPGQDTRLVSIAVNSNDFQQHKEPDSSSLELVINQSLILKINRNFDPAHLKKVLSVLGTVL
jgi:hypothetical protein